MCEEINLDLEHKIQKKNGIILKGGHPSNHNKLV
jgi:hypothetical protein